MDENKYQSFLNEISSLKDRLGKIEREVFPKQAMDTPPPPLNLDINVTENENIENKKPSNVLGYVGASCLVFAVILLIRFSIDSGWLTPLRQIVMATLFGLSLIFIPSSNKSEDRTYLALLPATGIAILHLTIYGSVFYYSFLLPYQGLIFTSVVGFLTLWLLSRFKEETYALMAIGGTYIGAIALKESFTSLTYFSFYCYQ